MKILNDIVVDIYIFVYLIVVGKNFGFVYDLVWSCQSYFEEGDWKLSKNYL